MQIFSLYLRLIYSRFENVFFGKIDNELKNGSNIKKLSKKLPKRPTKRQVLKEWPDGPDKNSCTRFWSPNGIDLGCFQSHPPISSLLFVIPCSGYVHCFESLFLGFKVWKNVYKPFVLSSWRRVCKKILNGFFLFKKKLLKLLPLKNCHVFFTFFTFFSLVNPHIDGYGVPYLVPYVIGRILYHKKLGAKLFDAASFCKWCQNGGDVWN